MRIPSLLIATALLASSAWAQDEERPFYLQLGFGGVSSEDIDAPGVSGFDPGYTASLAIGHRFPLSESFGIDAQLEGYYQYFRFKQVPDGFNDTAKAFAVMLNGIFDWRFTQQYSVYLGGGIGYAPTLKYGAFDSGSLSRSDNTALAAQLLVGVGYNMGGTYDVRLGYRYFRTESTTVHDATGTVDDFDIDIGQSSVEAVFRWSL